ncbi:uncharacterized protein AMSG_00826 [Thecamonas trahens ATCC 50062]|uniref:Uncharacterized protein n=1 Tax=Thecamonas trahens ATCC 50062 TaxID=461836 RepID=A0A0L0DEU8_THETB|nr:hypothetical protein AMSG_00826 [Thecamonas trahens ATCC 50062]KNC50666.1 hypothetical protein AMSG_00826 [Thecamonas trahens ATCC 50062]|eukprot:XP_013762546.1 hypothetical protein AMSG_00826 [Thecamonas trahens ATCC 50062]
MLGGAGRRPRNGKVLTGETNPISAEMAFLEAKVVNAWVVIRDVDTGATLRRLPEFTFAASEEVSLLATTTQPSMVGDTFNASTVAGFRAEVTSFNTRDYIYDYEREVPFIAFSVLMSYTPLYNAGEAKSGPLERVDCEAFEKQVIFPCDEPALNDFNYVVGRLEGRQPIALRGAQPVPARVAMGETDAEGSAVGTGARPFAWVPTYDADNSMVNDTMVTDGACSDERCGRYTCVASGNCIECTTSIPCGIFDQPGSVSNCDANNGGLLLCKYSPGNITELPAPRSGAPYYDSPCSPVCGLHKVCQAGECVDCTTNADCTLDFTPADGYTSSCSANKCNYVLPSPPAPVKSIRGKVILISSLAVAGVCCIGCVIAAILLYRRYRKNIEADNLMGDELNKEAASGKKSRFTFTGLDETDTKGRNLNDPFA